MNKRRNQTARYAIYARCSSDDQAFQDFSTIDVQQDLNRKQVEEKAGRLVGAYNDDGISGTHLRRKDFQRMLVDAQSGLFDVVLCTYMSRLGRGKAFDNAEYELEKCGVRVEMVKEQFTDDLNGYIQKNMTIMMDGMYPKQVSQWTKTKMEAMVKAGYVCGGSVPFGLSKEYIEGVGSNSRNGNEPPKRYVPHPDQVEIVQHAFALYLEKRTLAAVRAYLCAVTDRKWMTTTVKNLLMNEVYIGVLAFGAWRNEAAHVPIVERAIFQQVQDALGQFSPRSANGDDDFTYYLRGRVKCPHCGCPYTQLSVNRGSAKRPKNRIHYYVCSRANKKKSECPVVRVNAEALHYTVLHEMERAAKHHTVMHKLIANSGGWGNADDTQKAIRGQLAKKKQFLALQISNINNAIAQGGNLRSLLVTLERLEREHDDACCQLHSIETEIAAATIKRPTAEQVQGVWSEFVDLWPDMSEEDRQDTLGGLVATVEIKEKDRVFLQFNPIAEVRGQMLALNSQMGAVLYEVTNYPDLYIRDFAVPRPSRKGENFRHTADASASA